MVSTHSPLLIELTAALKAELPTVRSLGGARRALGKRLSLLSEEECQRLDDSKPLPESLQTKDNSISWDILYALAGHHPKLKLWAKLYGEKHPHLSLLIQKLDAEKQRLKRNRYEQSRKQNAIAKMNGENNYLTDDSEMEEGEMMGCALPTSHADSNSPISKSKDIIRDEPQQALQMHSPTETADFTTKERTDEKQEEQISDDQHQIQVQIPHERRGVEEQKDERKEIEKDERKEKAMNRMVMMSENLVRQIEILRLIPRDEREQVESQMRVLEQQIDVQKKTIQQMLREV
ncbi:coiled-coil domain-containing protein [Planoprotostelium fungivorum]|uniref:Coiled-coil domain-containing protein n=1 Tax=Planoprotostelium fungivorum TaxID=1890364 RepID=A0A2P6MW60_9EUKA|nr:coiled-coil domain-containing protein [Planoprotostelium fungivorum]